MNKAASASTHFDSYHKLVTSPFFSPTLLAWFRASVAVFTTATLIAILVYDSIVTKDAYRNFSFFTFLTYIGICSYYWASFVQTFWYIRRGFEGYPLQSWGKTLQILHLVLQNTVLNFPIIVTIVFWTSIATPSSVNRLDNLLRNISVHILNSVFCVFEMLLTNNPPPQWIFLPFMILIIGLYTASAYVTHATLGFYPYTFLDPEKSRLSVAGYIVGIVIAEIVIFAATRGLMKLREMMLPVTRTGNSRGNYEMMERDQDSV
ncbi:hypothetical protein E1B28_011611 [Marasmius oreades]|uniref:Uncharacterized protein n=1 Tax=Marasmius oreades TaxID=181124 RepID=A0A9P7USA1_9AGAR|nr:uncharacterized protein E1B28_011611 [Marasmius oreades]KAG7089989.1 hypothetical protein E1B28_011611 [Marasmius oreades]